jgi:hypothetical protein
MHLEDDDIQTFATEWDTLFDQEFCLPNKERMQFDMEGKVQQTIHLCIQHLLHDELYEDVGKQSEEEDDSVEDDESDPEMQRRQFTVSATARARSGQVYQAQRVNSGRAADGGKEFLQAFDVCMIAVDGNTRGATAKRNIPVLITQIVPYTSPATKITTYRY